MCVGPSALTTWHLETKDHRGLFTCPKAPAAHIAWDSGVGGGGGGGYLPNEVRDRSLIIGKREEGV